MPCSFKLGFFLMNEKVKNMAFLMCGLFNVVYESCPHAYHGVRYQLMLQMGVVRQH